jgi:hypothetical protein
VNANFITDDTDWLNAWAGSAGTLISVRLANETKKYRRRDLTPDQKRKMDILKLRHGHARPVRRHARRAEGRSPTNSTPS